MPLPHKEPQGKEHYNYNKRLPLRLYLDTNSLKLYFYNPKLNINNSNGKPCLVISGYAKKYLQSILPLNTSSYLHISISDDEDLAIESAIKGLSGYARLPYYQRVLDLSGYGEIVSKIKDGANPAEVLTAELVNDLALVGPAKKCSETLSRFIDAGADMPIITPNAVGKQSPLEVMQNILDVINS